jgi:phosphatidylglycerol---prolipoprotein diacylglyceryl transferase
MLPKLISFGDFFIPAYGVLVALAFLAGMWSTTKLARRVGLDTQRIQDLVIYCAITGLVGAKLLMFIFDWQYYLKNPGEMFSLSTLRAAGVYQGGFLLAVIYSIYYMRQNKLPVLRTMDCFAPGIALGHAIGRLGCLAAGCCYGILCERPWAITFNNKDITEFSNVPLGVPLHPTQLYEALGNLVIFGITYKLFDPQKAPGGLFALYLILYSFLRFVVEFYRRHDQAPLWGLPLSHTQWISLLTMLGGVWLMWKASRQQASAAQPAVG